MPGTFWKATYLTGYLGTIAILIAWYSWLAPSQHFHVALILTVLIVPLLFPLKGLLSARRYTIGWSLFLSLAYFTHGVVEAYAAPVARIPALIEVACSLLWFLGGVGYIRASKRVIPAAPTSQTES